MTIEIDDDKINAIRDNLVAISGSDGDGLGAAMYDPTKRDEFAEGLVNELLKFAALDPNVAETEQFLAAHGVLQQDLNELIEDAYVEHTDLFVSDLELCSSDGGAYHDGDETQDDIT